VGGGDDRVGPRDEVAGEGEELAPGGGQLHRPLGAGEEADAELPLELAQLAGQGRLGHVHQGSGRADRPGVGDGDEIPQVTQLHPLIMPHRHGSRAQEVLDSMTSGEDA